MQCDSMYRQEISFQFIKQIIWLDHQPIKDWKQILSFLSPDSPLSQKPLTKLDLMQPWYIQTGLVLNVKKDKIKFSKKCVWHLLCKLRSLEVDRVWHNGRRWKPRLPCHLSADRALTAIIWKGDKVSALCIVIIAPGADLTLILPDIQITPMLIRTQFMLQKCRL